MHQSKSSKWVLIFVVCVLIFVICTGDANAGIITATVEVVNSTPGEFVPLELNAPVLGYNLSRYTWNAIPSLLDKQPLHFWRVNGTGGGTDPLSEYGIISFNVVESGPVWLAVTTRFGGGGNPSGDWIPELSSRADLEADGWSGIATGLNVFNHSTNDIGLEFIVFERQSIAGESFTLRTEKYWPPMLLTTQISEPTSFTPIPEPTSLTLLGIGAIGLLGYGWKRNRLTNMRA